MFLKSVALFFLATSVCFSQTTGVTGSEKFDIVCGTQYECFGDEALMKIFQGKTVKYKHPRGAEFGVVTLVLNSGGSANVSNTKSSAGPSTWSVKDGKLALSTREWKDFSFHVVRVGGVFFFAPFVHNGLTVLVPFSVE